MEYIFAKLALCSETGLPFFSSVILLILINLNGKSQSSPKSPLRAFLFINFIPVKFLVKYTFHSILHFLKYSDDAEFLSYLLF